MLAEERRLFYVAVHPGPAAAGRHRGRSRPTTTASSRPASSTSSAASPSTASAGPAARCRWPAWSPSCAAPSPTPTSPSRCARAAARRLRLLAETDVHGRPVAPSADPATWWGLREPDAGRTGRCARRTSRSRCPPARSRGCSPARPSGSCSARPGARWSARPARASARSCTPSPSGSPSGDLDRRRDDLMPLVDEVWGRMEFRTPGPRPASARRSQAALARFVAWHHRPGARTVVGHRAEAAGRGDAARRAGRSGCTGTPTGSSSTRTAGVVVVDLKTGKYPPTGAGGRAAPPARPLPARGRPRRRRRARRPAGRLGWRRAGPARGSATSCPRCRRSRRRPGEGADAWSRSS